MIKTNILFVCLGNICRSPAAEAVMQKIVDEHGASDTIKLDSAGTSAYHAGETSDSRMMDHAQRRQVDITSISRQFIEADFKRFDKIIIMDGSNYTNVLRLDMSGQYKHKIHYMTEYCSDKFSSYTEVPDPYFGGEDGFEIVLDLLDDACRALFNSLK